MRGIAEASTCPRCGTMAPPSSEGLVACQTCTLTYTSARPKVAKKPHPSLAHLKIERDDDVWRIEWPGYAIATWIGVVLAVVWGVVAYVWLPAGTAAYGLVIAFIGALVGSRQMVRISAVYVTVGSTWNARRRPNFQTSEVLGARVEERGAHGRPTYEVVLDRFRAASYPVLSTRSKPFADRVVQTINEGVAAMMRAR